MSPTNEFKEYLQKLIELGKKPTYINEIEPAYAFYHHAPEYLSLNFVDIQKNYKDPPDFFIKLKKNNLINLEVTTLADKRIFKTNKFIRSLEKILDPIIQENKNSLPVGTYAVTVFPGRKKISYLHMDDDDFKKPISKIELKKTLKRDIPRWFKKYTEKGDESWPLCNNNGDQIVSLIISKLCISKEIKISIWPQGVSRRRGWNRKELTNKLQSVIDRKEDFSRYSGLYWLLISDREDLMRTGYLEFDLSNIKIKSRFFEKIFLIRFGDEVDELKVRSV
jgi:hypothetical protein